MADMDAPVCNISVDQVIGQPPVKQLPAIPNVDPSDPESISIAIKNITNVLNALTNNNVTNNVNNVINNKIPASRWQETRRAVERVKVYNKDDHDQWVEVERINSFTMVDTVTGSQWTWNRNSGAG